MVATTQASDLIITFLKPDLELIRFKGIKNVKTK